MESRLFAGLITCLLCSSAACSDSEADRADSSDAGDPHASPKSDKHEELTPDGDRRTIRIEREGGQTGMEGSCEPVPAPEPFSGEDVATLIAGEHHTTLAYRSMLHSLDDLHAESEELAMTVIVEPEGEAHLGITGEGCNVRLDQDAEITLRFDQPALDVIIEATVNAFGAQFAVVELDLVPEVGEALGLPAQDIGIMMAFDSHGIHGTLGGSDLCGSVVFPARAACPEWTDVDTDLDRERDGFRPRDALDLFDAMQDIAVSWDDGTGTTLSISLAEEPERACSGDWVATFGPERLYMLLGVRITTADGRIDHEIPAELDLNVGTAASESRDDGGPGSKAGSIEGVSVIGQAIVTASELGNGFDTEDGDKIAIDLHAFSGWVGGGNQTKVELHTVAVDEPALKSPIAETRGATGRGCITLLDPLATASTPMTEEE